ncbi:hypothetical protein APV28_2688 [Comamonas testosteroni]|nr:hypothetical protein APV28_2688 [Comamonas testosteroni]
MTGMRDLTTGSNCPIVASRVAMINAWIAGITQSKPLSSSFN